MVLRWGWAVSHCGMPWTRRRWGVVTGIITYYTKTQSQKRAVSDWDFYPFVVKGVVIRKHMRDVRKYHLLWLEQKLVKNMVSFWKWLQCILIAKTLSFARWNLLLILGIGSRVSWMFIEYSFVVVFLQLWKDHFWCFFMFASFYY